MRNMTITASLVWVILQWGFSTGHGQDRFHHGKSSSKVNYDSLFTAAIPLDKSDVGMEHVTECLNVYGGTEKLLELQSFELTYDATSRFRAGPFKLIKSFQRGRHYKINRLTETRILNGSSCWFSNSDTLLVLDRGRYKAELYSYLTLAMPLAIRSEHFDAVRYGERRSDPLGYIYLDKQDSLLIVLGIDRNEHLIRSVEGIIRDGDQNFVFVNHFGDYQRHEGFYFPGEITTISMGLEVSKAKLKEVKINPGFDADYFKPKSRHSKGKNSGDYY